ncbi:MAG: L,D-transpeptidase family protein [Rhodobacteraceae bacterium]|nr:L,D-transpeptidase family protein [Paracoccaceae bacterium]
MPAGRLKAPFAVALAATMLFAAPVASQTQVTVFKQSVAEAAAADADIAAFYRETGYAPLWIGTGELYAARLSALMRAVSEAGVHGLPEDRYTPARIEAIVAGVQTERDRGRAEVELSALFLRYARDLQTGVLTPANVDPEIKREVPVRNRTAQLRAFASSEPDAFIRALPPTSQRYAQLMKHKIRFERLVEAGGWGEPVRTNRTIRPGDEGNDVVALRNRLIRMGYIERTATATYDPAIETAVQAFQLAHGMTPDGVAGPDTVEEINIQADTRLAQILVAMERERWMNYPEGLGERHIWVNLTDFRTKVYDHGKVTFETKSVVGERRDGKHTPEFSDEMEYMELNPDWTVPRSILARDYLPRFQANPNAAGYLQLIDSRGRVVDRSQIDFTRYTAANFPFTVRQPPGDLNALGLVKFMFPNPHAIYLHDTPAKDLFDREVRAYSSGCIRLNDPFDLAYHLLARQVTDPKEFFDSRLATGRQTRVDLEQKIPVHLVYFTAVVTPKGEIEFRRDFYGRDAKLWEALMDAGVAQPAVQG